MRYIIQEYRRKPSDPAEPKVFIELDAESDMGRLFATGFLKLETVDQVGGSFEVYLYLKGRGVSPETLSKRRTPRGIEADDI